MKKKNTNTHMKFKFFQFNRQDAKLYKSLIKIKDIKDFGNNKNIQSKKEKKNRKIKQNFNKILEKVYC